MIATSPAAQVIIAIIPIVGIVIGGTIVFFYLLWRHREIMMLIKTSAYAPVKFNWVLFSLLASLLLLLVGLALTILFAVLDGFSYSLLGGTVPLSLGVGLLIFYIVAAKKGLK
ncbi:MAG: hypothetical protein IIW10_07310 [Spirochaetaceae bacterium]|nr:hypothetical protein [Spirochaetaceae bacterium]